LRFGFKVWQQGNVRADNGEAMIVTQSFLRRTIGDAYPLFVADQPRGHVDFVGAAQSIEFLSSAPVAFGHDGRLRFKLFVDRLSRRNDLVMTARAELADPNGPSTATRRVLLDDVKSAEFAYFGRARAAGAAQWRESWVDEVALPQLVRIRVTFADEARVWPELTIAPRIEADEACTYDVLTKRCQGR